MNAEREKILGRIRALMAKTTGNGCTEAEALAAAGAVSRLMERYQINLSETEVEEEGVSEASVHNGKGRRGHKQHHEVHWAAFAIGRFCDCRVWAGRDGVMKAIIYVGLKSDVAMAEWLTGTIRAAMDREWLAYRATTKLQTHARTARSSFMRAMARRVSARLNQIREARKVATVTSGRELMVVKNAVVADWLSQQGYRRDSGQRVRHVRMRSSDAHAFTHGTAAGDGVGFDRPISGGVSQTNSITDQR
jgi:hypothetical protein